MIAQRLAKAKIALVLEHPFVGNVALNLPFLLDEGIPTAATDGKEIRFNPAFVESLTDEELKFLVAHECMHPMLEHVFRRGKRDHAKWNRAADYVVNQLLVDEGIGKMPDIGLCDRAIYDAGKGFSENIYDLLKDSTNSDGGGAALDDCRDSTGSPAEQAKVKAEWKVRVAQAAQVAKMMGKLSATMQRLTDQVLRPKVDWKEVLFRFIERCVSDTRSWARPNRRFLSQDMYLPSTAGESLGEIVLAIDCSGSVRDPNVAQFTTELRAIKEYCNPSRIHVLYFNTNVTSYESYGIDDVLDIKPKGGGGTAYSPVFKYIAEHRIEPVACVFLTDLECSDFGKAPAYPVLWVSIYDGKVPFGEKVIMR